jgi:hypothetical protein
LTLQITGKAKEKTILFEGRDNIVYDYRGTVYCCCLKELKLREMAYAGSSPNLSVKSLAGLMRHYRHAHDECLHYLLLPESSLTFYATQGHVSVRSLKT